MCTELESGRRAREEHMTSNSGGAVDESDGCDI
jgi:hypothetical protein